MTEVKCTTSTSTSQPDPNCYLNWRQYESVDKGYQHSKAGYDSGSREMPDVGNYTDDAHLPPGVTGTLHTTANTVLGGTYSNGGFSVDGQKWVPDGRQKGGPSHGAMRYTNVDKDGKATTVFADNQGHAINMVDNHFHGGNGKKFQGPGAAIETVTPQASRHGKSSYHVDRTGTGGPQTYDVTAGSKPKELKIRTPHASNPQDSFVASQDPHAESPGTYSPKDFA